jgi:hypothetical protein
MTDDSRTPPGWESMTDAEKDAWMEADFQRAQEAVRNRPPPPPRAPRGRKAAHMGAPMELVRDVLPCARSGAMLAVAILIWRRTFLSKTRRVKLKPSELEYLGVSHDAQTRALRSLTECGFITVEPDDGKRPFITLLWGPAKG